MTDDVLLHYSIFVVKLSVDYFIDLVAQFNYCLAFVRCEWKCWCHPFRGILRFLFVDAPTFFRECPNMTSQMIAFLDFAWNVTHLVLGFIPIYIHSAKEKDQLFGWDCVIMAAMLTKLIDCILTLSCHMSWYHACVCMHDRKWRIHLFQSSNTSRTSPPSGVMVLDVCQGWINFLAPSIQLSLTFDALLSQSIISQITLRC